MGQICIQSAPDTSGKRLSTSNLQYFLEKTPGTWEVIGFYLSGVFGIPQKRLSYRITKEIKHHL